MWPSWMFWRLFGTYAGMLLIPIGVLGVVVVNRAEHYYRKEIEEGLRRRAILVGETIRDLPVSSPGFQKRIVTLGQKIATRITLLDDDGRVLADSDEDPGLMENHGNRPEVLEARGQGSGTATRFSKTLGKDMMYLAIRPQDLGQVAFVRVALPLEEVQDQLGELKRLVWTAVGATALVVLVMAFALARRITRPIQELTAGAEQIAAGNYGSRVYVFGRDEIGNLARTFNNMSERLADQFAQLAEDRQQLRMILTGMVEGVVALDGEQRILFANDRAAQLLEFQAHAAVGRKFWEVIRKRPIQEIVRRALVQPEPHFEELSWNGSVVKSLTVHAAQLPGSPTRGAVLVLHDTTELRRLERLRQDFVANVSHELKTPLSVITACVETLLDGALDDPEHRNSFLEQIEDQANRLHYLILDLLSLARIESGTEAFVFEALPLEPVVTECLERHHARAEAKNQRLESVPAAEPTPVVVWADEESVGQILDNLVDNALKYTPAGGVIRIRWWTDAGQANLEVQDTGIGIPEQDLPRIFERFYRVDKARSRELGGTGLGLSIVKHLVQAMHGTVRATSRLGKGTTFLIQLPLPPVAR